MPQTHSRLKLNEDGACDVPWGRVGIGAVVRDGEGKLKAALLYSSTSGISPHATEALAALYGMRGKHPFGCSNHNEARRTNK
ncbi:putative ribonuclease H-like domain-containing protein [Rosa chinensis]|uniref:Putative ribonuclease H-like domain-containing protein n=1 Tax=Rosa chinensis TaxID=74649 RepID=A0A2P6RX93_ROSCH|nr:putative ribonuclease H-like domain-containing protein [Rosa chinensis]